MTDLVVSPLSFRDTSSAMTLNASAFLDGGEIPPARTTLRNELLEVVKAQPNRPEITVLHQREDHQTRLRLNDSHGVSQPQSASSSDHLEWSYAELDFAATGLWKGLFAHGVHQGDVVATFLDNNIEWAMTYLAVIKSRTTIAPLDRNMLNRPEELAYHMNLLKPQVVFVKDATAARRLSGLDAKLKVVCGTTDDLAPSGWKTITEVTKAKPPSETSFDILQHEATNEAEDTPLSILFTSGTTASPKGCARTQRQFQATSQVLESQVPADRTDRFLLVLVNFRAISSILILHIWRTGGSIVFPDALGFTPASTIRAMLDEKITQVIIVPIMLYAIGAHPDLPKSFPHLRSISIAGDIVTGDMLTYAKKVFGSHVSVRPGHGMTEGQGMMGNKPEIIKSGHVPLTEGSIASVGKVAQGCRIRITHPDSNEIARVGEEGDLHCSTICLIDRYLEDRSAEDFYEDEQGKWFKTGDIGMIDKEGFVYILGRSKDVIMYSGIPLSPAMIEVALNEDPQVMVCCNHYTVVSGR